MAIELYSKVAGRIVQDPVFANFWMTAEPLAIPYFGGALVEVTFAELNPSDPATLEQADEVLANLLRLTITDRQADTAALLENHQLELEYIEELLKLTLPNDIWQHIHPTSLVVTPEIEGVERDPYVLIGGNCDWDEEHGIALVFRRGLLLTRFSQYDGHLTEARAWGEPAPDPLMDHYYATFGRPT